MAGAPDWADQTVLRRPGITAQLRRQAVEVGALSMVAPVARAVLAVSLRPVALVAMAPAVRAMLVAVAVVDQVGSMQPVQQVATAVVLPVEQAARVGIPTAAQAAQRVEARAVPARDGVPLVLVAVAVADPLAARAASVATTVVVAVAVAQLLDLAATAAKVRLD